MTIFVDLALKIPLILAISIIMSSLNSCSAVLSIKKKFDNFGAMQIKQGSLATQIRVC